MPTNFLLQCGNLQARPGWILMQTAPRLIALLLFALFALGSSARADDDTPPQVREAFVAAMAAVTGSPFAPTGGDSEVLQRYSLYPYLQAARLGRQLELIRPVAAQPGGDPRLPLDDDIAAFLAQQGDRPVTRKLRSAWLAHLAERQAWSTYVGQYREDRDTQSTLRCHWLAARVALGQTDELEAELTDTWLTAKSLPDACDPPLAWWRARGGPADVMVERRARLALAAGEAGLARFLARSLPAARAAPLLQWAALIEQPGREIPALIAQPAKAVEPQALADGWSRFARADAEAAAAAFPSLAQARGLEGRAASPYAVSVALALSWSRHPRALDFFRLAHADDFDERTHEWHVRAALWAGDWRAVAAAIAAMPADLRDQPRWRYWSARASEKLGDGAQARELYAAVIPTDNWYAAHAAARLDRKFTPRLEPLALSDAEVDALAAEAAFVRTRELLHCDMDAEATAEWRAAYDELPPSRQVQAVGLASRWGWHDQAIATAARQKLFNDYDVLYPRPFDADVRSASRRTGLPEELIYAIIRQESLFRADAASGAGAIGLMQLLPETARVTARRAGLPEPTRAQLIKPAVNIPLGSEFLASLVQRFEGETALAAAGYNAGPNAARRWRPAAPMDLDVWVENIPFNETRTYVQRVAWHALVFAWLADRKPREVSNWQRAVRPAASTTVAVNAPQ
jgi:soluble lytic murein transglycosylase